MSLLYEPEITDDGSYIFTSDFGFQYRVYFSEAPVPDKEGNIHSFLNLGFSRDSEHLHIPYSAKYDPKIELTIIHILNELFEKFEHRVLFYFCFGDDGFSRHRKIVFNQWKKKLNPHIENHNATIKYEDHYLFSCLMLVNDNPLRDLIIEAFNAYLQDF